MSESVLRSKIQSPLINISDDHLLRALDLRNSRTQQAHRSSTKDHGCSIFGHQAPSESMQRNTERLQQRTNIQSHILRQLVTPFRRVIDPLLQRTLEMREALAAAPELELFANVIPTLRATGTATAGQADFESNSIACLEACDG